MNYHLDSWKNKEVFKDQLELNEKELDNYPQHWKLFLNAIEELVGMKKATLLDIGCGVGTYKELCRRHTPAIEYTGMDYSQEAIDIAQQKWGEDNWRVGDYQSLTEEDAQNYDILHAGALLDILPNGDEALSFLLGLGFKNIILGRLKFTPKESTYTEYRAYNKIQTYAYYHNVNSLLATCEDSNYNVLLDGESNSCTVILKKNQSV
jgi:trans-aconitate methyltransferase